MESKLFTIIIPTYNRCTMLEESLQMVVPQVRKYKDDVRVYVSDNASTDDTKRVVEQYLEGNEDIIIYFQQSENCGAQKNFRHAVKSVNSKYVCLLGDDDIVFPNYVETIVSLLKSHPDVGLINYNVMSVNYELRQASFRERDIRCITPIVYSSGKELIYNHLTTPSLVSSNVFFKDNFVSMMDTIQIGTYPGYDWFAVLYHSIMEKKCIFLGLPILLQRCPSEQRWVVDAPWYHIYGFGRLFKDMDSEIPHLYEHWMDYSKKEGWNTLNYILTIVANNKELYKERFETMRPYMCSPEYSSQFRLRLEHSARYIEFVNAPLWFVYLRVKSVFIRIFSIFR